MSLVTRADIDAAAERIAGQVHRTPVLTSRTLDGFAGRSLFFKAEVFQRAGSFKLRGALNKVLSLSTEERQRGIVTLSAGNAAAAYSLAGQIAGVHATVVMPKTAVPAKVDAVRGYGGEVVFAEDDLLGTYESVRDERHLVPCHPFDDPAMIAGNGTLGAELLADMSKVRVFRSGRHAATSEHSDVGVDAVVVPVGGGGLISGVSAAMQGSGIKVIGVEPEGAAIVSQSLAAGEPLRDGNQRSVADGLAPPMAGAITLAHVREYVDEFAQVTDDAIMDAVRLLATRAKLIVEPSGAAGLAAILTGAAATDADRVAVVLSGGNLNLSLLA